MRRFFSKPTVSLETCCYFSIWFSKNSASSGLTAIREDNPAQTFSSWLHGIFSRAPFTPRASGAQATGLWITSRCVAVETTFVLTAENATVIYPRSARFCDVTFCLARRVITTTPYPYFHVFAIFFAPTWAQHLRLRGVVVAALFIRATSWNIRLGGLGAPNPVIESLTRPLVHPPDLTPDGRFAECFGRDFLRPLLGNSSASPYSNGVFARPRSTAASQLPGETY